MIFCLGFEAAVGTKPDRGVWGLRALLLSSCGAQALPGKHALQSCTLPCLAHTKACTSTSSRTVTIAFLRWVRDAGVKAPRGRCCKGQRSSAVLHIVLQHWQRSSTALSSNCSRMAPGAGPFSCCSRHLRTLTGTAVRLWLGATGICSPHHPWLRLSEVTLGPGGHQGAPTPGDHGDSQVQTRLIAGGAAS